MTSTIVFLLVRHVLDLIAVGPTRDDKDVEIAILRQQLPTLHRQVARLATHRSLGPRYAGQVPTTRGLVSDPGHAGDAIAMAS